MLGHASKVLGHASRSWQSGKSDRSVSLVTSLESSARTSIAVEELKGYAAQGWSDRGGCRDTAVGTRTADGKAVGTCTADGRRAVRAVRTCGSIEGHAKQSRSYSRRGRRRYTTRPAIPLSESAHLVEYKRTVRPATVVDEVLGHASRSKGITGNPWGRMVLSTTARRDEAPE